jgi:hypothetical protein
VLNAALAAVLALPVRAIQLRVEPEEGPAW